MKITVYLNESDDSFRGFDFKTARLRQAIEFDLDAVLPDGMPADPPFTVESFNAAQAAKDKAIYAVLDGIFTQLNVGGDIYPAEDYTVEYRAAGNRSLSVGDVVALDGVPYAVGRFGWDKAMFAALKFSVLRYDRLGAESPAL